MQWTHGKEDPPERSHAGARLMVYLGTDADAARKLVAQAEAPAGAQGVEWWR